MTINSVPSSNKKTEVTVSIPAVDGAEIEQNLLYFSQHLYQSLYLLLLYQKAYSIVLQELKRYNFQTGKLEETANCKQTVSADGSVKVAATGMAYIISAKKLSGNKVETIKERISVRLQKNVVKAGKKVSIKLSLPDVVSKKKKFGTEKATITYNILRKKVT